MSTVMVPKGECIVCATANPKSKSVYVDQLVD